jgi:anti-anti-sigma factor
MCTTKIDLECRSERGDGCTVLWVSGEIDLASWQPFGLAVYRAATDSSSVIIDLGAVTHFDGCAVRALRTALQLRPDTTVTVRNARRMVRLVLEVTGMGALLIDPSCSCEPPCRSHGRWGTAWVGTGSFDIDLRARSAGAMVEGVRRIVATNVGP